MARGRTFGFALALLGAALAGNWLASLERPADPVPEPQPKPKIEVEGQAVPAAGPSEAMPSRRGPKVGEEVAPANRNVTPPGVLPGPAVEGPMVRVPGYVPPVRAPRPEIRRHPRVIVETAGTFSSEAVRVRLAGIQTVGAQESCRDAAGAEWPCGRAARSALQRLIRARTVDCDAAPGAAISEYTAYCRVGPTEINRWLVEQGWARPAEGAPAGFQPLFETAQSEGRGLFRKTAPRLEE